MQRSEGYRARLAGLCAVLAVTGVVVSVNIARAEQPPAPCHPNPTAAADEAGVRSRGDVVNLPAPLQDRLAQLANRPHTYLPLQAFNEADGADQLFQYYLLDTTGFEPNVFTTLIPGVNDHVQLTVTEGNCGLPTVWCCASLVGTQTWASDRSERPSRFHRCLHRHQSIIRDQQRERLV